MIAKPTYINFHIGQYMNDPSIFTRNTNIGTSINESANFFLMMQGYMSFSVLNADNDVVFKLDILFY